MTRREIESKIAKYLRKANRLKSTQAKLARINELIDLLQATPFRASSGKSAPVPEHLQKETSAGSMENYLELCDLHKIKFQMDAVFFEVKTEIQRLKQNPEQINQEMFDHLMSRLQAVLELDADHPEIQAVIQSLQTEYDQYARNSNLSGASFNLAEYRLPRLCIEITCHLQDVEGQEHLKAIYKPYQVAAQKQRNPEDQAASNKVPLCRMRFYLEYLKDFETFHEELRVKPSYQITVNNRAIPEQFFSDWFQCYRRFIKANNPQYCYGASPFTFNFFGCHKLYVQDIAKQLGQCWFRSGTFDQDAGLFFVTPKPIADQIRVHLERCGFCPALTQEKLAVGMALLPKYINPERDPRWKYYVIQGERIGVIPSGNEIAIASLNSNVSAIDGGKGVSPAELSTFIEVGSTPCINKVLHYLDSNDLADLSESAYKGISTCLNCGAPYKPHTMTCSRCRLDFWRSALKDLEKTLHRLRYLKKIKLPAWDAKEREASIEISSMTADVSEKTVSFEQLWHDPQVQKLLSQEEPLAIEKERPEQAIAQVLEPEYPESEKNTGRQERSKVLVGLPGARIRKTQTQFSGRPDFHEKLRSFVSRKYRERKAIENAFSSQPIPMSRPPKAPEPEEVQPQNIQRQPEEYRDLGGEANVKTKQAVPVSAVPPADSSEKAALINAVKSLRPRQKSELSKRGVVRVIYHATMDKDTCPLCHYLDGTVMDPDDPATDIFSPPLYPGCTCSREYVLKTEKPKNWPKVTFTFPPGELLIYLDKKTRE